MKNIVHVLRCFENGGTEKYVINLIKNTYKDYKNIIVLYKEPSKHIDELKDYNIEYVVIDDLKKVGLTKFYNQFKQVLKKYKADVVYSYTHYNSSIIMFISKMCHVKIRITHSHRSSSENRKMNPIYFLYRLFSKLLISIFSTDCLACGKEAGQDLFFRKFKLINNGIDTYKYEYNQEMNYNKRKELNIDKNTKVIGMVGRLDSNKNNVFMINIFDEYHRIEKNSKLVIVGDGDLKDTLKSEIHKLGLDDSVLLLGSRNDVNELYNSFDIFTLTSIKEGIPFVLIEAQTNGLKCLVSDSIDKNSDITGNIKFLSLNDKKQWLDTLCSIDTDRKNETINIEKNGYSIEQSIREVKEIYEKS